MKFVEASVFTKIITQLMSDDDYRAMQEAMIAQPDIGSVIKGTGGLRKFRWKLGDSGKWVKIPSTCCMPTPKAGKQT